ncbi:Piso0_001198 [Millerozyma farinosa CBS 7064]|uniref:Piso0_001198 protein n=1 Tax=Pichia sorbitophila (strain ATCC MYA-4447 / BCRC 22081 / CBS 7064 / NBRC 10061 / NRRL Y-12695) TaxID=559304 RepID=G8YPI6_PICSO|nr:Piso0_001198 [Millerozyma farinosa CBS 7064]CCE79157.1 Piso0_001198 [Millerozyma farinosa CBS 7064]
MFSSPRIDFFRDDNFVVALLDPLLEEQYLRRMTCHLLTSIEDASIIPEGLLYKKQGGGSHEELYGKSHLSLSKTCPSYNMSESVLLWYCSNQAKGSSATLSLSCKINQSVFASSRYSGKVFHFKGKHRYSSLFRDF